MFFLLKLWKLFWFLKFPVVVLRQIVMKENIVQKASTLFIQRGFKSVTMDDLADALATGDAGGVPQERQPYSRARNYPVGDG